MKLKTPDFQPTHNHVGLNLTGNKCKELDELGFITYVIDASFSDPHLDEQICAIIQQLVPLNTQQVFVAEPKLKPLIPRVIAAIHGRTGKLPIVVHMVKKNGQLSPVFTDLMNIQRESRSRKALEVNQLLIA